LASNHAQEQQNHPESSTLVNSSVAMVNTGIGVYGGYVEGAIGGALCAPAPPIEPGCVVAGCVIGGKVASAASKHVSNGVRYVGEKTVEATSAVGQGLLYTVRVYGEQLMKIDD
jgi:hypothetical protein